MIRLFIILLCLVPPAAIFAAEPPDLDEQERAIAAELRCVVCQNLSILDSPSEMAQQMRAITREQLKAGKTPGEIKNYFVSKYGDWVLLAPAKSGFSLLVWIAPFAAVVAGIIVAVLLMHRWARKTEREKPGTISPALLERVRRESSAELTPEIDLEDQSPRFQLLRERATLYREMRELEFDFEAGKMSETDYKALRQDSEAKAAVVLQQLESLPASRAARRQGRPAAKATSGANTRPRQWRLAAGGAFLLIFGLVLGAFLMQSLRARISPQDSLTGDFLTGTSSSRTDIAPLLKEGRSAFARQEWPKAIEALKKVIAADPNQPEAHTYMGFILIQAGDPDGALLAFDKALATNPNFPPALWGKGMLLYREKQDHAAARELLEKLVAILPAGKERSAVAKALADISRPAAEPQQPVTNLKRESVSQQIRGTITLDPKLAGKLDSRATLFIIARRPNAEKAPPLAVQKIARPGFPLSYALGAQDVMMQGMAFTGKVNISVRLDKDGNPMTRESGNLFGEHKKNPVELGATNVDVIIDQVSP
jgi:cytochrome c-type biogenesis protein CcmH